MCTHIIPGRLMDYIYHGVRCSGRGLACHAVPTASHRPIYRCFITTVGQKSEGRVAASKPPCLRSSSHQMMLTHVSSRLQQGHCAKGAVWCRCDLDPFPGTPHPSSCMQRIGQAIQRRAAEACKNMYDHWMTRLYLFENMLHVTALALGCHQGRIGVVRNHTNVCRRFASCC
jgi:hypothetical protein